MTATIPANDDARVVEVLILSWIAPAFDYARTNHLVAESFRSVTLTSPPQTIAANPSETTFPCGPALNVRTTVKLIKATYPEATRYAEEGDFKKYDVVIIVGFEGNKETKKAIPAIVLEKVARRFGFPEDGEGNKGDVEGVNGVMGFKGDKDFYQTKINLDQAEVAMKKKGYKLIMTRDFSKDVIPKGGPVKPYVCEYLYGQILREVEGKSKPLVTLIHMTYEKGEKGHEGGPYTVKECIELTQCLAWYMAEQSVGLKGAVGGNFS